MVYVLSKQGKPLMPTKRYGKVRRMLNSGKAKVVKSKPFTIRLTYETTGHTQPVTLGIDSGYEKIGYSAITEKEELITGEVKLLKGISERLKERSMYRSQRRSRKRYRKPRFDNRKRQEGWLAPSIQHKFDSHIRFIKYLMSILPITETIIEVANFDIQKIKNPTIEGKGYQEGEQYGYRNLREYILHRDGHKCQNPDCKNKSKNPTLEIHHMGFWKGDRSNRPGNLITLCDKCHTPANHKGFLYGWEPKVKSFKPETFMTIVRWKLVNALNCRHTYGYITKQKRIELGLDKTHNNDAFVIAGGTGQKRCESTTITQVRRNNRSLQKFYDAKYIDIRTGKKASGQELNSGRRARNRNLNGPNLRVYRGQKLSKGRVQIRRKRYPFQPGDIVIYRGKRYTVKGVQNHGNYVRLAELSKPVKAKDLKLLYYSKGLKVS